MATYNCEGRNAAGNYVGAYVTAPGSGKDAYRKAARKAEAKLTKQGEKGVRIVSVRCVG